MSDYFKVSLDELMRGETNQAVEERTKEVSSLELKTRGLLQEWSNFLSNLSDSQKVKLTYPRNR